jgi:ferredoxin-NADP reductase
MGKYTVEAITYVTPTILRLSLLQSEDQRPISFLPGQYAGISFRRGWRKSAVRCFSIASSPVNPERIEFGIRIGGKFTQALTKLKPGTIIDVKGPFGNFVFEPSTHKEIVLCAGGIGITPFMSMVRYATKTQLTNKIALIISARNKDEIPYYAELQDIVLANPHIEITYVLGGEELPQTSQRQSAVSGRVTPELLCAATKEMHKPIYFICGPPPFMDAVTSMLASQHIPEERVVTEAFAQGKALQVGNSLNWPSTMYLASAIGAFAITAGITVNALLKNITPTLLPDSLLSDEQKSSSARQTELDALVNKLQTATSTMAKSPAVVAAENEVSNGQTQSNSATPAASTSNTQSITRPSTQTPVSSQPVQPAPAPPAAPVCTTSASGVTTCQ